MLQQAIGGRILVIAVAMSLEGAKDMLQFLIARDTMHQQQRLAVVWAAASVALRTNTAAARTRARRIRGHATQR